MAGQSHLARLFPFSPLSFPRKRESSAPKPVTPPWIPACAGMTATLSAPGAGMTQGKPLRLGSSPLDGGAIAFGETVAFLSSVIPAEAGIQRPKIRHSPLDSRFRGNDGNREV